MVNIDMDTNDNLNNNFNDNLNNLNNYYRKKLALDKCWRMK